ncbi:MAG: metal-dependent transcriptional regulator [Oscillospiraceae bacterium]|jgi:Mn-dependent DtxR family transcriptional regulator|nr:metal-dependent transcriptional regulator [Oscillospiraceae bacterium]
MSQRTFRNESRDDYLEAILIIRQKKGFCRSTDIASWLGISRPSVSVELGKLAELGLIRMDEDKMLHLTDEGFALADSTYAKHVYLKRFLMSVGVDEAVAEKEACSMEHALSNDSFEKILARYPSGAPEA